MSSNQLRKRNSLRRIRNVPVDNAENMEAITIIDLTVDSPKNPKTRNYRIHSSNEREAQFILGDDELPRNTSYGPPLCPICYDELVNAVEPTATRCGHVYCKQCLVTSLKQRKLCPKCQSTITERSCIRLYF